MVDLRPCDQLLMTSIAISLAVIKGSIIKSYKLHFLLISTINLHYLTLYAHPPLKMVMFWQIPVNVEMGTGIE